MHKTQFPTHPQRVVSLMPHEFLVDVYELESPSLDAVCGSFVDDANRALVWVIRFQALKTLSERVDMIGWFENGGRTSADVCEVAARFQLNDRWEFDRDTFCSAVDAVVLRRSRDREL
jgi:hypothetical protein